MPIGAFREPASYAVHFQQDHDGGLSFLVEGVGYDGRSRLAVAASLRRAACQLEAMDAEPEAVPAA